MGEAETQCLENLAYRECLEPLWDSSVDPECDARTRYELEMRRIDDERRLAIMMATRAAAGRDFQSQ